MLKLLILSLFVSFGVYSMPQVKVPAKSDVRPRIILGEDANEGQFPYMVSLNYQNGGHACGASILTSNWVLTAGHCCLAESEMDIFAGNIYLSGSGQTQQILKFVVHKNDDPNHFWTNDICAIQLEKKLKLNENVQQITLPKQNWPVNDGDFLNISGWGYTNPFDQIIPDRLQVGYNFVALSNNRCLSESGIDVTDDLLCVRGGSNGQGVCNGDSGSPLVKDGVQVGIASFVFTPCGSGYPDFYSRVPHYINWIKKSLGRDAKYLKFIK